MIWLILISALLLLSLPAFLLWAASILFPPAPFVPIPAKAIPAIITALQISPGQIVYDIGCGDGRVLFAAARLYPDTKFIGVDLATWPIFLARLRLRFSGLKNVSFVQANAEKISLKDADRLFTYLFPEVMEAFLPKFRSELKPGARLISADFTFKNYPYQQKILSSVPGLVRGANLYRYDF